MSEVNILFHNNVRDRYNLFTHNHETVADAKSEIAAFAQVPVEKLDLYLNSIKLDDAELLDDYQLQNFLPAIITAVIHE